MIRTRVLSGLAGLGLLVGFAGGQPPTTPAAAPKPAEKAKGTLEEAIAAALKNNPDVRVAEAEAQVAQAKLAQAKLAVAQKVAAAHAAVERAKAEAATAEAEFNRATQLQKKGFSPQSETDAARQRLESSKAAVAKADADYNAALGVMPGKATAVPFVVEAVGWETLLDGQPFSLEVRPGSTRSSVLILDAAATKPVTGSVADKLREVLDKPIKWDAKRDRLGVVFADLFKAAGGPVTVRVPATEDPAIYKDVTKIALPAGEMSVGAWLELILDETASIRSGVPGEAVKAVPRYDLYLREYGLLLCEPALAPRGAVTVQDFWKQVKAEKAAKDAPKK